ncbi:MAG: twin-arginine translocase TatA/TatE family subunit [Brumimicrobium sp.]|nr:twin-arginine translocase TatA/TatE family subunit [Brumimicrobium sp.]
MLLFLNSIAGSEIVVILLFILIFFGSKSIPGMSRTLGRGIRQIRDASQDIQDEIRKSTTDMRREMNINRTLHETKQQIEQPFEEFSRDIRSSTDGLDENIPISPHKPAGSSEHISENKINKDLEPGSEENNQRS